MSRLKILLASRRLPAMAIALAFVLSLPSLRLGLVLDDLWHRAKIQGGSTWQPTATGTLSLFSFVEGTPDEHARLIETGFVPWWISPNLRISFFRPVSCLTHALDYALWPSTPSLMHLHSVLWYLAFLALAAVAYRRLLPPLAANIAVLFFAIDPMHAVPVGWIANRNAIVAGTFALGALILWDAKKHVLAALVLALALASGESATAILALLLAHWLFLDRRPLRAALPVLLVVLGWVVIYRLGRHGVVGSGIYTDPIQAPGPYAVSVLTHVPMLVGAELGAFEPGPFPFLPFGGQVAVLLLALGFIAATVALARRLPVEQHRVVRFLGFGGLLGVLPGSATFPAGRLLLLSGFGIVGLVALVCAAPEDNRVARIFRGWIWTKHVFLAPLLFVLGLHDMNFVNDILHKGGAGVPVDGSAKDKRLILVNAPDTAFAYYIIVNPLEEGGSPPRKLLVASGGRRDVRVTRTGERALTFHEQDGFYRTDTEILFRDPRTPFKVGDRIEQSDATLTITHVLADGTPDEATLDLPNDLANGYVFLVWKGRTLEPFTLPPLGESVTLPGRFPQLF